MILTEADRYFLVAGLRENKLYPHLTKWYFGAEPLAKQYAYHQARQPNVTWVGSIASGKSWGIAASVMSDCLTLPGFKALSTSITSAQAEIPFEMAYSWITSEQYRPRIDHLIADIVKRPYPLIRFKNGSSWLFRTAGQQATHIRGLEFDRVVFDEAGYEYDIETMNALRGRLRGERLPGIPRMARLDATTSPTDCPWLRDWFARGTPGSLDMQLADYAAIRSTIYDNTHITDEQIRLMKAGYSDEMIRVELMGEFPDYGNTMFPARHIATAEDRLLNDAMELAIRPEKGDPLPGWREDVHPRHGVTLWERPYIPGHIYVEAGDPGMGDVPNRNAGAVMVLDVTYRPYSLAYLHWVSGRGSYMPFLDSYRYALDKYYPSLRGLDATGTQAAMDELAFEANGIEVSRINFNRDKSGMLNALSLLLTNQDLAFPFIKGLHLQLARYTRNDKDLDNDLVMTLAMIAFLIRHVDGKDEGIQHQPRSRPLRYQQGTRHPQKGRYRRSA
ncbi:terminase large subunit domain-containing protein [Aggregatilinea lenta]|uniref:terminase large subunit domain-containing protein n=1 Tax=Aggregatilinea lenta TaxID=913108 RepID=UPI000E5AA314|nr:terminase family protein [Aggregatilinea lenta]